MTRRAAAFVLAVSCALGTARAQDTVLFRDPARGKEEQVTGVIEAETPAGIRIRPARGAARDVAPDDIHEVRYKTKVAALTYRDPFGKERAALEEKRDEPRRRLLDEALKGFQTLAPEVKDVPNAHRYIQYKTAGVLARLAEVDSSQRDAAVAALAAFRKEHPGGWEIAPALKQLARLQEEKGDVESAGQTYADLASVPSIPRDARLEAELLAGRLLIRAAKYPSAEARLQALAASLAPGAPQRAAAEVYLAQAHLAQGKADQAEAQARSVLDGTADGAVLAAAHNLLGDCLLRNGKPEDAFWEYLKVDVLYGQDREEHARALYHLAELFDKVKNDPVRARECRTRVEDKQQFGGTEYHRKAVAEKK
jgi:hypothetical protein